MATESDVDYWRVDTIKQHSVLILLCLAIGLLIGTTAGLLRPANYTAEVRLAVGTGTMSDLNVPGFPTASADIAANYARWVETTGLAGMELPEGTEAVRASPFPQSNVIRIEAVAQEPAVAKQAAAQVAATLENEVNAVVAANDTESLLQQASQQERAAAEAEDSAAIARRALESAREEGQDSSELLNAQLEATTKAARERLIADALEDRYRRLISTATTEAVLTQVGNGPALTGDSKNATIARYGLVGLGGGLVAAVLLIRILGARRAKHREPT